MWGKDEKNGKYKRYNKAKEMAKRRKKKAPNESSAFDW